MSSLTDLRAAKKTTRSSSMDSHSRSGTLSKSAGGIITRALPIAAPGDAGKPSKRTISWR